MLWQSCSLHINSTTFASVSAISLPDNTFTSTFDHYKIIFDMSTKSIGNFIAVRYRASASDISSSDYQSSQFVIRTAANTSLVDGSGANASSFPRIGFAPANRPFYSELVFYNPNKSVVKGYNGFSLQTTDNATEHFVTGGGFDATTIADSLTFFPTSGNFSGVCHAFGYAKG